MCVPCTSLEGLAKQAPQAGAAGGRSRRSQSEIVVVMSVVLSFALTCGFLVSPRAHVGHRQRSITRCPAIRVQTLFPDDPVRLNQPAADEDVVSVEFDEVDDDDPKGQRYVNIKGKDLAVTGRRAPGREPVALVSG